MSLMTRLLVSALCAVSLAIAGVSLERLGPRPVNAGSPEQTISGAWSCPHGGGEGWRVWVSVTNPGTEPVEIRMTTAAGGASTPAAVHLIEPGMLNYFEVSAPIEGSATVVEYLGGVVVAGTVVVPPEGGQAASPCEGSPGTLWHTVEASTLRGETALLVIHNPFAAQAVVDVILTAGDRQIRPGRLQGVVLGPQDARGFELNKYALGLEALGATVVAHQGRVSAASVILSSGGARASLAVAFPATSWYLPGAGAQTAVLVRALDEHDSPVSAELQGEDGPVPAIDLEAVSAGTIEAFGVLAEGGFLVEADGGRPMLAGLRMTLEAVPPPEPPKEEEEGRASKDGKGSGGKQDGSADRGDRGSSDRKDEQGKKKRKEPPEPPAADLAATEGSTVVSDRWVVPPAVTPDGGPSVVLLQNPGQDEVEATVTLIGISGIQGSSTTVTIPAHATARLAIPDGAPVAALVEGPGLVASQASLTPGAFAVSLGLPIAAPSSS
jgi:hypothetical protein